MTDHASGLSNNGYFSFFCKVKYHFNARWYDADTARFISEDPARFGKNWYRYASQNPLKYTDPTGLRDWYDPGGWSSASAPSFEYEDSDGESVDREAAENEARAKEQLREIAAELKENQAGLDALSLDQYLLQLTNINEQKQVLLDAISDYIDAGYDIDFIKSNTQINIQRGANGDPLTTPEYVGNDIIHHLNEDGIYYDGILSVEFFGASLASVNVQTVASINLEDKETIYAPAGIYTGWLMTGHNKYVDYIWLENEQYGLTRDKSWIYIHFSESIGSPGSMACQMPFLFDFNGIAETIRTLGFNFNGNVRSWRFGDQISINIQSDSPGFSQSNYRKWEGVENAE
jgi:hypothetical protein